MLYLGTLLYALMNRMQLLMICINAFVIALMHYLRVHGRGCPFSKKKQRRKSEKSK